MRTRRSRLLAVVLASLTAATAPWIGGSRLVADQSPPQGVVPSAQTPSGQRGQPAAVIGTGFLAGQVVDHPSGRGVPGASVVLNSRGGGPPRGQAAGNPWALTADSQGRFFFADLPAGSFTFQVGKAGYSPAAPVGQSRVVELADAERITDVRIRLAKLAAVAGTIRDEAGDPVVGTDVWAIRRRLVNGRRTLTRAATGRSDDHGAYRIPNLVAGDYFVCACGRDPIPLDGVLLTTLAADPVQLMAISARALVAGSDAVSIDGAVRAFAPTLHPNSPTMARAMRVTVGPGEERTAVDVEVTAVRATRVSGTLTGAIGPMQAASIRLVPAGESEEASALAAYSPMLVQPNGRFDFTSVPPGSYTLRVVHTASDPSVGGAPSGAALAFLGARGSAMGPSSGRQLPNEAPLWAAEPISVGDEGVSGLSIALRRSASISGRVQFSGSAAQPTSDVITRLAIIPEPAVPDPANLGFATLGRFNPDGTFKMAGILPGRYGLTPTGLPGWPTLKSIAVGGADVTDLPIEVDAADIADVVITLADTPMATLTGVLTGARNPASPDSTILIFPTDRRYWNDPAVARRRFRGVAASRAGAFTVAGLPSGEYFVVAVPDESANEWQEASRLETLSAAAQRVALADGDRKAVEVKR